MTIPLRPPRQTGNGPGPDRLRERAGISQRQRPNPRRSPPSPRQRIGRRRREPRARFSTGIRRSESPGERKSGGAKDRGRGTRQLDYEANRNLDPAAGHRSRPRVFDELKPAPAEFVREVRPYRDRVPSKVDRAENLKIEDQADEDRIGFNPVSFSGIRDHSPATTGQGRAGASGEILAGNHCRTVDGLRGPCRGRRPPPPGIGRTGREVRGRRPDTHPVQSGSSADSMAGGMGPPSNGPRTTSRSRLPSTGPGGADCRGLRGLSNRWRTVGPANKTPHSAPFPGKRATACGISPCRVRRARG